MQEVGDKSSVAYVAKAMRKTCEVAGIEPLDVLVFEFPAKKSADGDEQGLRTSRRQAYTPAIPNWQHSTVVRRNAPCNSWG